jgi:hypothetical protein
MRLVYQSKIMYLFFNANLVGRANVDLSVIIGKPFAYIFFSGVSGSTSMNTTVSSISYQQFIFNGDFEYSGGQDPEKWNVSTSTDPEPFQNGSCSPSGFSSLTDTSNLCYQLPSLTAYHGQKSLVRLLLESLWGDKSYMLHFCTSSQLLVGQEPDGVLPGKISPFQR